MRVCRYSLNGDVVVSSTMEEEEQSPPRDIEEWARQKLPEYFDTFWSAWWPIEWLFGKLPMFDMR